MIRLEGSPGLLGNETINTIGKRLLLLLTLLTLRCVFSIKNLVTFTILQMIIRIEGNDPGEWP
jgi:hypothetical protein